MLNDVAIAHNGNILDSEQRAQAMGIKLRTECDSEIILHFLAAHGIKATTEYLKNEYRPYALLIMRNGMLHAITEGQPLHFRRKSEGIYLCSRPFEGSKLLQKNIISEIPAAGSASNCKKRYCDRGT